MKYDEFEIVENMDKNEKLTDEERKRIHSLAMAKLNDKTETVNFSDLTAANTAEQPAPKKLGFVKYAFMAAAAVVLCGGAVVLGLQLMKNNNIVATSGTATEATSGEAVTAPQDFSEWTKSSFGELPSEQDGITIFTERKSYDINTETIKYYISYLPADLPAGLTDDELMEQYSATCGEECTVEMLVDGEWRIPPVELIFNSLGYMIAPNGKAAEFTIYMNSYNMLSDGHYRVVKTLYGAENITVAAEFDLTSSEYKKDEHIKTAVEVFGGAQIKAENYIAIHDYEASDLAPIYSFLQGNDSTPYINVRVEENNVVTVYDITRCGAVYHIIKCSAADNAVGYSVEYFNTQYLSADKADGITENADMLVYQNESGEAAQLFAYIVPETESKVLWSAPTGENTVKLVTKSGFELDGRFTGLFGIQLVSADGLVISETNLSTGMVGLDGTSLPTEGLDDYFGLYELQSGAVLAFSYPLEERYLKISGEKTKYYLTSFYGIKDNYIGRFMMGKQGSDTAMPNEGETILTHSLEADGDSLKTAIWWDLQFGLAEDSIGLPQTDVTFEFNFERLGDLAYSGYSAICRTETAVTGDTFTRTMGTNDYSVDGVASYSPVNEVTINSLIPDGWFTYGNSYYNESGVKQNIRIEAVQNETFEHFVERNMSEVYFDPATYTVKRDNNKTIIYNEYNSISSEKLLALNKETGEQSTVYLYLVSNSTTTSVMIRAVDVNADAIAESVTYILDSAKEPLTLDVVKELAAKGDTLTWSDFEQYKSMEIGSGLYILLYEIDDRFNLMIGGVPDEKPMYIRLVRTTDDDSYIDIRTEDVESFIAR